MNRLLVALFFVYGLDLSAAGQGQHSRLVEIGTIPERMRYDKEWVAVTPGERITLELKNTCRMQHNLVICRPRKGVTMKVAQAAWMLGAKAVEMEYIPDHPDVLFASALVNPGESSRFTFTAPLEKRNYPYVCTLPGHAVTMKGILHVGDLEDKPPEGDKEESQMPASAVERAKQKMKRYRPLMDGGPALSGVILPGNATMVEGAALHLRPTNRGMLVRIGEDGEGAILFDKELMRVTAAWKGEFVRFLEREDERAEYRHEIGDAVHHRIVEGTGWASPDGSWEDPRESGYGQLPAEWAHYMGYYLAGERVVMRYRIGGVEVLDSPWLAGEDFERDLEVAASSSPLRLRLAAIGSTTAAVSLDPHVSLRSANGYHDVTIAPRSEPVRFKTVVSRGRAVASEPMAFADNLEATPSGPPVITKGSMGKGDGPYVVDTLSLPYENPWNALLYTSGFDFFANGDAAVCTSHGDVWAVRGIDAGLQELRWRRVATGLANPLGLRIVDDTIYVVNLHEITRLHDFNGDGVTDYYESFNAGVEVSERHHRFTNDLHTDSSGSFYYLKCTDEGLSAHSGSVIRVSPDGSRMELFATGLRNPNGMAIGPGDVITFGKQQGGWIPSSGIHVVEQGKFYGYMPSHHREVAPVEFEKPLCWIPHGVDNSCGGQAWAPDDERWGPLRGKLLHLSYGKCQLFVVLHERVGELYQGGVVRIPDVEFDSGAMRARFREQDGQLYVCGLRGWQTTASMPGCFQRVRYTGKPVFLPASLSVEKGGVRLEFLEELDGPKVLDPTRYEVHKWQYRWTENYGSPDYTVSNPDVKGRDWVSLAGIELSEDRKSVLLRIDDLEPVMQMAISYDLATTHGKAFRGEVFNTINVVPAQ